MFTSKDISLGGLSSSRRGPVSRPPPPPPPPPPVVCAAAFSPAEGPAAAFFGPAGSTVNRFPLRRNVILAGRPSSLATGAGTVALQPPAAPFLRATVYSSAHSFHLAVPRAVALPGIRGSAPPARRSPAQRGCSRPPPPSVPPARAPPSPPSPRAAAPRSVPRPVQAGQAGRNVERHGVEGAQIAPWRHGPAL